MTDYSKSEVARKADWRAFRLAQARSFESGGESVPARQFTIRGEWNDLSHLKRKLDGAKGVDRDGMTVIGATSHPNDEWEVRL